MTSISLWVPLVWIAIIGSRPASMWFGVKGLQIESVSDYLDGSPFDRNFYIVHITIGLVFLLRRNIDWNRIFSHNRWFTLFTIFCGFSCIWSFFPFTSLKRYIKILGSIIMVLLILTEENPKDAIRAVLSRYAYFAIIISVLFIKYFPELGRSYHPYTWEVIHVGISVEKNSLGRIVLASSLFIIWDLLQIIRKKDKGPNKIDIGTRGILIVMSMWLLLMANSSTAIICLIVGCVMLLLFESPFFRRKILIFTNMILGLALIVAFSASADFLKPLTDLFNRDVTLTGRTDLWRELLQMPANPVLGAGFESFWISPLAERINEGFYFFFNQAHNGYIEVFIQLGIVGLILVILSIFTAIIKMNNSIEDKYSVLMVTYLLLFLIYSITEATINKQSVMWFIPLMAQLYVPGGSYRFRANSNMSS